MSALWYMPRLPVNEVPRPTAIGTGPWAVHRPRGSSAAGRRSAPTPCSQAAGTAGPAPDGAAPIPVTESRPPPSTSGNTGSISTPSSDGTGHGAQSGVLARFFKRFFQGSKLDKERLLALGFGGFAAYGVISNVNAGG